MKKLFIAMILVSGVLFTGCGKDEGNANISNNSNNEVTEEGTGELNEDSSKENKDEEDTSAESSKDDKENKKDEAEEGKEISVDMYLYDVVNDKWVTEKSKVNSDRIKDLVIEIRNNPLSGIPKNTKIYSVTVKDRIATVDVGKDFLDPNTESSAASNAKINSIVNTLCLNKELGIDGVMFLVEGKKVETIGQSDGNMIFRPTEVK